MSQNSHITPAQAVFNTAAISPTAQALYDAGNGPKKALTAAGDPIAPFDALNTSPAQKFLSILLYYFFFLEYHTMAPATFVLGPGGIVVPKTPEIEIAKVRPLYSLRRLAELFDLYTEDGRPATDSVREWWHSGRIPPPDLRVSRKGVYWRPETIDEYIRNGGTL